MAVDQEILDLLEGRELSVKDLAIEFECPPASLYKPLAKLVRDGLVRKTQRFVQGKRVAFYSVPSEREIEGCLWQDHKEILLAGKMYPKNVLQVDFGPFLKEEIVNLRQRQETLDILITGLKGVGKSVTAIWLASQLDLSFSVKSNIVLRKEQLLKLVVDQPISRAFVLDDLGTSLSSRGWAEQEREVIFSFFEICRQNQVDLIGTSPSLDLVDLNFRRLIRYVWDVQLRCDDHVHILVHKSVSPGLKPSFKPIGVLTLFYPASIHHFIKEYELVKRQELKGAAQDALERLERAKEGVEKYIWDRPVLRVTDDVVGSALESIGLDGSLPREDKQKLRIVMFDALQQKEQKQKAAKAVQAKQAAEKLRRARLLSSFKAKYQSYLDQDRTKEFALKLSDRLVYEKEKAKNLKNLQGAMGSLFRKVKHSLVEDLVLARLDDIYLVRDLRTIRDVLGLFKDFDQKFYSKLFLMILYDPQKANEFVTQAKKMRKWFQFQYHGKFSPKRWRESVESSLARMEAQVREAEAIADLFKLGVAAVYGLVKKQPGAIYEVLKLPKKKFWGDV